MSSDLKLEIKQLIINTLKLEDLSTDDIDNDDPLFGDGLELDSLDGLELVLQLEKKYGVKIGSSEASREALKSVNVLAEFIQKEIASAP